MKFQFVEKSSEHIPDPPESDIPFRAASWPLVMDGRTRRLLKRWAENERRKDREFCELLRDWVWGLNYEWELGEEP